MSDIAADVQAEIGERIRRLRKLAKKTQVVFSEELGIGTSELARLEIGYAVPSEGLLEKIAKALKVEVDWLKTGVGASPEPFDDRRLSGAQIRKMRETLSMTRDDLSSRIGVKPSTLHNVELGHQRLGPAATTALRQLVALNSESGLLKLDDRRINLIIDRAIEETYRVMTAGDTMNAVKALSQSLGDDELTIVKNLVKNKVRGAAKQVAEEGA